MEQNLQKNEDSSDNKNKIHNFTEKIKDFYDKQYKKLLLIPFAFLFFSIALLGYKAFTTGEFINRDVSLKGGVTITIPSISVDINSLESELSKEYPLNEMRVRAFSQLGEQKGVIILSDIKPDEVNALVQFLEKKINKKLTDKEYSIEIVGTSLGYSFYKEVIRSLIVAFIVMSAVVFLYFGQSLKLKILVLTLGLISSLLIFNARSLYSDFTASLMCLVLIYIFLRWSIPSFSVVLGVFSDIVMTLAIINLMDFKISSAGIAAFLMLIGYSVDTDILLSTRVLKRTEGTIMSRVFSVTMTGMMMTFTTIIGIIIALIFTQSDVIKQIMIILLIGLVLDIMNTWIQNVGILRIYLEIKQKSNVN